MSQAKIIVDKDYRVAPVEKHLFGSFIEHLGRAVYSGIYEPGHPKADEQGFRTDVLELVKELGVSIVRYPGGNFVSGYNWVDGIGPKDQRKRRLELSWKSIETNEFGIDEFVDWCHKAQIEVMAAVNLGTGTPQDAGNLVEYCNHPSGSYWSDLRIKNGHRNPHNIKVWCLGNEMDGPWQICHLEADDYGKKARETAKIMKWIDPDLKLVVAGSSGPGMPTFPEWDRVVLETCWEHVNYLSIHMYVSNHHEQDTPSYLALSRRFEEFVDIMASTLRYVKAKNRSQHDVYLSWDEWQVWHPGESHDHWTEAPHLAEYNYNLEDALVVTQWLNVFLRKCDVLKIACVAQIVNIISWLHTTREALLKETSFYPFQLVSNHARGNSLDLLVRAPLYTTKQFGDMPLLDAAATHDPTTGAQAVFLVNRSQSEPLTTTLTWQDGAPTRVKAAYQISGTDPKAENSFANPHVIVPKPVSGLHLDGPSLTLQLPPLSFTTIALG